MIIYFSRKRVCAVLLGGTLNEYKTWPNGDKPAILF